MLKVISLVIDPKQTSLNKEGVLLNEHKLRLKNAGESAKVSILSPNTACLSSQILLHKKGG